MEDKREIENIIDEFYSIISGSAEDERNWDKFRELFFSSDSSLTSMKYNSHNECITKRLDVESYIVGLSKFLNSKDFYEYGFNYEIKVCGNIANVYSEYAAKRKKEDSDIIKKGINLAQFIYDGEWKIHSMLWQDQ